VKISEQLRNFWLFKYGSAARRNSNGALSHGAGEATVLAETRILKNLGIQVSFVSQTNLCTFTIKRARFVGNCFVTRHGRKSNYCM
jgi:hypothetical protein